MDKFLVKPMITGLRQYKCGNCGCERFELYADENAELIVECTECSSTTIITVTKPRIDMRFGEKSDGMIYIN